jgi:hypothetical protein
MDVAQAWHSMCELAFKEHGNLNVWITVKILAYNGIRQDRLGIAEKQNEMQEGKQMCSLNVSFDS